jgi:hypothetical protein
VHAPGRHVEDPTAAMHQYASDDLCHVIDEHVVAVFGDFRRFRPEHNGSV